MPEQVVAIIPARGGSKGIPGKNIKDFCGKPLLAWTIEQARATAGIDSVYVSSDSEDIRKVAEEYGAKTIVRPDDISGDTATSEQAIEHALGEIGGAPEYVLMLQETSPLRKKDDLSRCIGQCRDENWDSCFSGALLEDFLIWRDSRGGGLESVNYDWRNRGLRQDRAPDYVENGSIYMFRPSVLLEGGNRLGGSIGVFLMEFWQSFELDAPEDWALVESLYRNYLGDE